MRFLSREKLGLGLLVASLIGGSAAWIHHRHHVPAPVSGAPAVGAVQWQAGVERVYSMSWRAKSKTQMGVDAANGTSFEALTHLEAELHVRNLGDRDGAQLLGVRIADVRLLELSLNGKDTVQDADLAKRTLTAYEAYASIGARGIVQGISFAKDTPIAVRNTLQTIVEQLQITAPESAVAEWDAMEFAPNGTANVHYGRSGNTITRRRQPYLSIASLGPTPPDGQQSLDALDTIVLDDRGGLDSMRAEEVLSFTAAGATSPMLQTSSSFTLTPVVTRSFDPTQVAAVALEMQPLGFITQDPDLAARRREQLAAGVTIESVDAEILAHDQGGIVPRGFVAKAGAFLELHPELCAVLEAKFEDAGLKVRGRGLILDLLATAGSAAAQKAMREALSSDAARGPGFATLFQRFAAVPRPDKASVDFVATAFRAGGAARGPAAVTLGVMIRRIAATDAASAKALNQELLSRLAAASTAADKRALIIALGNARSPENAQAIKTHAIDAEPIVRAQTARALAGFDTPDARATVVRLAGDADSMVARDAITSLGSMALTSSDWADLKKLATRADASTEADAELVRLVGARRTLAGADGDAILRSILARTPAGNGDLLAVVRQMLEGDQATL